MIDVYILLINIKHMFMKHSHVIYFNKHTASKKNKFIEITFMINFKSQRDTLNDNLQ